LNERDELNVPFMWLGLPDGTELGPADCGALIE
jgi:hypothetical protein